MTPFRYCLSSHELVEEIAVAVAAGDSVVLLGPSYSGKRCALAAVRERLESQGQRTVNLPIPRSSLISRRSDLTQLIMQALAPCAIQDRSSEEKDPFELLDHFLSSQERQPVLLLSNIDAMAHPLARVFLVALRAWVEARKVIVVLSGEYDLRDLVHGPNSEFNCAHQYMVLGYGRPEFEELVRQQAGARAVRFEPFPDVVDELWRQCGGSGRVLGAALHFLVERRARRGLACEVPISIEDLHDALSPDEIPWSEFEMFCRRTVELVAWQPESWPDLQALIGKGEAEVRWIHSSPSVLEFAGIATRKEGKFRFSSPLIEMFAKHYYAPRRFADLYAQHGRWQEAFERYEGLDRIMRPVDSGDCLTVEAITHALAAQVEMEATHGVQAVDALFRRGCNCLLGFPEVTFWRYNAGWQLQSGDGCKDESVLASIAAMLPASGMSAAGWYPLPESQALWAAAAILKAPDSDRVEAAVVSDHSAHTVISKERARLLRELIDHFVNARNQAMAAEKNQLRLQTRERHVEILNAILDSVGSEVLDGKHVLTMAARGLRKLAYKRVEFCLVDPKREWIDGVLDDSDDAGVDLAAMTHYRLSEPEADIQPYVIFTAKSRVVENAKMERLASPKAVAAARLGAFAVVPIIDRERQAIGTVHVEREDGAVPSSEEIADLESFGRQLATVIAQSERVNLLQTALNKIPEPLAIIDTRERLRYANRAASQLFGVHADWVLAPGPSLELGDQIQQYIRKSLDGECELHHFTGIGSDPEYKGEILTDAIRDWRGQVIGGLLHVEDLRFLHRVFQAMSTVARANDMRSAQQALLDASILPGQSAGRLYLLDRSDGLRFVSVLSKGLQDRQNEERFNAGGILFSNESSSPAWQLSQIWLAVRQGEPVVFQWRPDVGTEHIDRTAFNVPVRVVTHVACPAELEKRQGSFWVDVPLAANEQPIGKLTLACDNSIRLEQLEMLKILGEQGGALLAAWRERERREEDKEHWIRQGFETSISSVAHNLASRIGSLPVVLARYRRREETCKQIAQINCQFGHALEAIMDTMRRVKDLLGTIVVHPSWFDLDDCVRVSFESAMPGGSKYEVLSLSRPFRVYGDRHLIESALIELIQNSSQFIREPSELNVTVELERFNAQRKLWVRLCYRDNGPGIPPEIRDRVFEEFFSHRPGQKPGTGLGLAFVRRVVSAHGGRVTANAGPGAEFVIELPDRPQGGSS